MIRLKVFQLFIFQVIILSSPFIASAQSTEDRAKAYFLDAKDAYEAGNCTETQKALNTSVELLESSNATIEALRTRCYVRSGNYLQAKKSLGDFFKYGTSNTNLENEMLGYLTQVESAIADDILKHKTDSLSEVARISERQTESYAYYDALSENSVASFQKYLSEYPQGVKADEAKKYIYELKEEKLKNAEKLESLQLYEKSKAYIEVPGELVPYYENGKWGYFIKSTGYRWIEAKYLTLGIFKNGIAVVQQDNCNSQIINVKGEVIHEVKGLLVQSKSFGNKFKTEKRKIHNWQEPWENDCLLFYRHCDATKYKDNTPYDGLDVKEIIVYIIETNSSFSDGPHSLRYCSEGQEIFTEVADDYILMKKNMIIKSNRLYDATGGKVDLNKNSNSFYKLSTRRKILPNSPFILESINNNQYTIGKGKFKYYSQNNEGLNKQIFEDAYNFSSGLACVSINNKYGFINTVGEIVIPCKYKYAKSFYDGVACVQKGKKWFFINKKGQTINDLTFLYPSRYVGGYCIGSLEKYGGQNLFNKKGELLEIDNFYKGEIHLINDQIFLHSTTDYSRNAYNFQIHLIATDSIYLLDKLNKDSRSNLDIHHGINYLIDNIIFDWDGNLLGKIPAKCSVKRVTREGYFIVESLAGEGLLNERGHEVLPCEHFKLLSISNHSFCAVSKGNINSSLENYYNNIKFYNESGKLISPRVRLH
ncbi:MAG: WG repeat-containing protein [Flavobacteriales bacterium]|nr:WG repeat-containing protein [Flavobacteriales bacterium]